MGKKKRKFVFSNGLEVELRKVSPFVINKLRKNNINKISVPEVVKVFGTRQEEKLVKDYNNENYRALVDAQQEQDLTNMVGNLLTLAIVDSVPEDAQDYYYGVACMDDPEPSDNLVKQMWLLDQIEDAEEYVRLQEAITGQTMVTDEGVKESQEKFPDDN